MKRITSLALGTLALLFCLQARPAAAANSFTIAATWQDTLISDDSAATNTATGTLTASIPFTNVDITTFGLQTELGVTLESTTSGADFFDGAFFHALQDDTNYMAGKTNVTFTDSDPAGSGGTMTSTFSWTTNQLTIHCTANFDVFGLQYAFGYEVFDTNGNDTSHFITDVFDYNDIEFPLGTQVFSRPIYVTGTNTANSNSVTDIGVPLNSGSMSGLADYIPPTVTITAPLNNSTVTTNLVTFSGTAADNIALGYLDPNTGNSNFVLYVLNGVLPPAEAATFDGTNWTQPVTLNPGPNTFVVQSIDQSGNVSAFATDVVTFIVASPLALAANPQTWGTVSTSAANTNAVEIGTINTATATAKPGFEFTGWIASDISGPLTLTNPMQNPLSFDMSTNLMLTANFKDIQPPAVRITSPAINAVSNSIATFAGTATDNVAVASVTYILNGQPSVPVASYDGSNNWSTGVNLNGGTNVFVVTAIDTSGNSTSVTAIVNFIVVSPLELAVNPNGDGTISGNVTSGESLVVSSNYTVTANANSGFTFNGWTATATNGPVVLPNPTQNPLTFTMYTNLELTANFVANSVFTNSKGSYSGLFYATNTDTNGFATNSGYLSLMVLTSGHYSGVITMLSGRYPFTGQLSYNADTPGTPYTADVSVSRARLSALDVDFGIDVNGFLVADPTTTNAQGIVGSAPLLYGAKASALTGTNTNSFAGTYNLVMPGQITAGVITNGNSYGTVTVARNGQAVLTLNLADASVGSSGGAGGAATAPAGSFLFFLEQAGAVPAGTVGISSGFLDANSRFPFFIPLYTAGSKGLLMGTLAVAANGGTPADIMAANVDWIKMPNASTTYYSNGFSLMNLPLQGSFFAKNLAATNINFSGTITIQGGNLAAPITANVSSVNNSPTLSANPNKIALSSFNLITGQITGTFEPNPASSSTTSFKALYVPGSPGAFGFFIGTNETGTVELDIP